jgi:hypothetical protein
MGVDVPRFDRVLGPGLGSRMLDEGALELAKFRDSQSSVA